MSALNNMDPFYHSNPLATNEVNLETNHPFNSLH